MDQYLPSIVGALVGALTGVIGTFVVQKKLLSTQIEWQQRVAAKNMSFQTVQAEWNQMWQNWHVDIANLKPGMPRPDQPERLSQLLVKRGVFKNG